VKENADKDNDIIIKSPPNGFAILALVGPSLIWCAEYIGSGEVILATRTGSILGTGVLWAIVVGIFLKYWIGMSGARYTVCTGEGMVDMFGRIPGPAHWAVWVVLVGQFAGATISMGAIASASGAFVSHIIPIGPKLAGWLVALFGLAVAWSGMFDVLKVVMSIFVVMIVLGVLYVAGHVLPGFETILKGLSFEVPHVPQWAIEQGIGKNPWREMLPLIGWGAGGFASQVWYTYWVLGAGYGAAAERGYGKAADIHFLKNMTHLTAQKIKGWCRVVYADATLALLIGTVVTCGFLIAGAGVLRPNELVPQKEKVASTLSTIFSSKWGAAGGFLFMLAGASALISTLIGQLAGWPRLLADSFRICIPGFEKRFPWKVQFRGFLIFFLCTNMIIVFTMGMEPVVLVKISAVLDGLLLTPLQAIWVAIGLFVVMPRLLSKEAAAVLRPNWIFAVGLIVAFLVFGYFCIFQIPTIF
jgi:Mn2+/Fe2+ NRAMP family transporter